MFGTVYLKCKGNKILNKFKSLIKSWLGNLCTCTIYSKLVAVYYWTIFSSYWLVYLTPLVSFYSLWEHQKTRDFLMFWGSVKRSKWHEMQYIIFYINVKQLDFWNLTKITESTNVGIWSLVHQINSL